METDEPDVTETSSETPVPASPTDAISKETETTVTHRDIAEWHGKELVDRDGEKIGKLEDVYFDIETDEPQFGTVKEGLIGRHLTFVPLTEMTIGPDNLQVSVSKEQVKDAPHHPTGRRRTLPSRRISPLPPLPTQLHPIRHPKRTPTRPPREVDGSQVV
jgi:hypothetical protein